MTAKQHRHLAGRWPANVILDESQAAELDKQSGVSTRGGKHWQKGHKHH
jgi:hypothetical protein